MVGCGKSDGATAVRARGQYRLPYATKVIG
jgi:hypothetical protein